MTQLERYARNPKLSESEEQTLLIKWAAYAECIWPEIALLHHIPNGGKRGKAEAARFKAEGVKAGVPDLCLPVPRGQYHGLYIEMKAKGGKASAEQKAWIAALTDQGYAAQVCIGFEEAKETIEKYLKMEKPKKG